MPPLRPTTDEAQKTLAEYNAEAVFWRNLTTSTFRFPHQPLLNEHGERWKQLYQRLNTETRAYTWGKSYAHESSEIPERRMTLGGKNAAWPTEMFGVPDSPIVSLQCGGWHTSLLTSSGELFAAGKLSSSHFLPSTSSASLKKLEFPKTVIDNPKIHQFSAGRGHILGLSDDGRVWLWSGINTPAYEIVFDIWEIALLRHTGARGSLSLESPSLDSWSPPSTTTVVAGWSTSSAFIRDEGIIVWKPDEDHRLLNSLVNTTQIPKTSYRRPKGKAREASAESKELGETFGQVVKWVVLEAYIVILTDLGKVFGVNISDLNPHAHSIGEAPVQLSGFEPSKGKSRMIDIQGSFRSFAVFNSDGDVILADQDLLDFQCKDQSQIDSSSVSQSGHSNAPQSRRPPALQNRNIIALAFGDYHLHALTAQGHVLSFGHEPQACGCLGLGGHYEGAFLRGVVLATHHGGDNVINTEVRDDGLGVWFSPEQREWLFEMRKDSMKNTLVPIPSGREQAYLSRYFEKRGADWDLHPAVDNGIGEEWGQGQPAYFTLSIAAAGWHSAALVLVNEARTEKLYKVHKGFLPPSPEAHRSAARPPSSTTNQSRINRHQNTGVTRQTSPWQVITNTGRRLNGMIFGEELHEEEEDWAPSHVLAAADQAVRNHHEWYHDTSWSGDEKLPEAARHGVTVPQVPPEDE